MQANKKITPFVIASALIFLLSGCLPSQKPVGVVLQPSPTEVQSQLAGISKRFRESTTEGPTVVESAMELSEKYAKLSDEAAVLRGKVQKFTTENHHLKDRGATLETQLQQTKKELVEANDLLIEMRIELNNWKADILGYRDEMRDAEKTQLEALFKILKVLGGEVKVESPQAQDTGSAAVHTSEPSQPQPQSRRAETTLGESNE